MDRARGHIRFKTGPLCSAQIPSLGGKLPSMPMARSLDTHFLNVDLDIYSKRDLRPLVDRLGHKVRVLFAGREKRNFSSRLEIASNPKTADATIRAFCRLIDDVPKEGRRIWAAAIVRSFSVGVQAEIGSPVRDFQIKQGTVTAASNVVRNMVAPRRT
jgi:hypothetical protein